MAPRRALSAALAAVLMCCASGLNYSTTDIYKNYYASGTTPLGQSFAAAKSALNGLQIRVALITILQNNTWFPDNGARVPARAAAATNAPLERALAARCGAAPPDAGRAVTYGDGYAFLTGWSSNRLVPLLRAVRGLGRAQSAACGCIQRAYRAQPPALRAGLRCERALALTRHAVPHAG